MKTLLITGMHGTLAPVVARRFAEDGWRIVGWDRNQAEPDDPDACYRFWDVTKPDAVCHLALGSEEWAARLAIMAAGQEIPYLFTSSVMVFDGHCGGPFGEFTACNAGDEYGHYKIRCEECIRQCNPDAIVARIGWQIGSRRGGNTMLEHLWRQMETSGRIAASTAWFPACSLMADTAQGILELVKRRQSGTFHLDSNSRDRLNFFQIVTALKTHHCADSWQVEANQDYVNDQRLLDDRIQIRDLSAWLPL